MLSNRRQFDHVVLLAPLIRIHYWPILRWLYRLLKPWLSSVKRSRIPSSHDQAFNQFLHHQDPLQTWRIPLCWLGAMDQWYQDIKHSSKRSNPQPLSIIQGTRDTTVDWHYNLTRLKALFPNHKIHQIPGARHHLVKESQQYWQPIEKALTTLINTP